jgi:hypothetical protein
LALGFGPGLRGCLRGLDHVAMNSWILIGRSPLDNSLAEVLDNIVDGLAGNHLTDERLGERGCSLDAGTEVPCQVAR